MSVYKTGSDRVTTHMEVAGGYVKEIWLVSGWDMGVTCFKKFIHDC